MGTAPFPGRRQFSLHAQRHVTGIAVRTPAPWYGIARSWLLIQVGLSGRLHLDWGRGTWTQGGSSKSRNPSSEPGAHVHGDIAAKRVRGCGGGPVCRKSCFHGTRWPGSGPPAVVVALEPCAIPSRPPSAKPSWWACIRSGAALAASGFGSSALLSPWGSGPRSPALVTLRNATCVRRCWLIGFFRYLDWILMDALNIV